MSQKDYLAERLLAVDVDPVGIIGLMAIICILLLLMTEDHEPLG